MNIKDLIDQLKDIAEAHGDGVEVRLAIQPHWAFEHTINGVEAVDLSKTECDVCNGSGVEDEDDGDIDIPCGNCDGEGTVDGDGDTVVVYIGEGNQLGYLPSAANEALGWKR